MNERILQILENLLKHEISKSEAQSQLLHLCTVIGMYFKNKKRGKKKTKI